MNLDPTLFDSPMYETANEAVLFCKDFLQEKGYAAFAQRLMHNTPVSTFAAAVVVRDILVEVRPQVSAQAVEYVDIAKNTVERAMSESTALTARVHRAFSAA